MIRLSKTYKITGNSHFLKQLFQWGQTFDHCVWLDSNHYPLKELRYDVILAVGCLSEIQSKAEGGFDQLEAFQLEIQDWCFGYLSFDMKNDLNPLSSDHYGGLDFPDMWFFQPEKIVIIKGDLVTLHYPSNSLEIMDLDIDHIQNFVTNFRKTVNQAVELTPRLSKLDYIKNVLALKAHIQLGDIYEINYCMEWFQTEAKIDPALVFHQLNELSLAPFSCYLKNKSHYALCSSPERYLSKTGRRLVSQPIKGTSKRFLDQDKDQASKLALGQSEKERSENVMIVDLVRNDLSKVAQKGSVRVDELFGLHTFKQVHQMISTISADLHPEKSSIDAIKASFPMGSMTGAPKLRAMTLIEKYERSKRGLYSGAIGYFEPNGDFDFNVVIRTILYNAATQYVSYSVGSAITSGSDAELEYEECLLKADALSRVLRQADLTEARYHD